MNVGTTKFVTSPETEKLDAALAKVQGEVDAAAKDSTNPHFRSKYADLSSVWAACRAALTKHGVSVTQWPVASEDGCLHLITRVACEGQWMCSELSLPVTKADPQGFGSAITYARRYGLAAAIGVVADDDDDGNAASTGGPRQAFTNQSAPPPAPRPQAPPKPKTVAPYPVITEARAKADPEAKRLRERLLAAAQEATNEKQLDQFKALLGAEAERYNIPSGEFVGDLVKYSAWLEAVKVAWIALGDKQMHEADPRNPDSPF